MYACMYVCVYACMHVCMHACMHVCMYACMHVCMHVCMYVCMHACIIVIKQFSFFKRQQLALQFVWLACCVFNKNNVIIEFFIFIFLNVSNWPYSSFGSHEGAVEEVEGNPFYPFY